MRSLYIALLTIFVAFVWIERVSWISWGSVYSASRMAEAGKYVVNGIVHFQFYAIQVLAVIMLSGAISEEIYSRTLNVLMSTPVSSLQIVMGKLLSRLLQLMLLLAISLPLLAIVRVFGGVPWDFLISSLCITLTAAIFVGSISLFFSIFFRRFYTAIIMTMLVVVTVYTLLPFFIDQVFGAPRGAGLKVLSWLNPLIMMISTSRDMLRPGVAGTIVRFWPVHCGLMLCISAVVLLISARFVRKAALRRAAGKRGFVGRLFMRLEEWSARRDRRRGGGGEIRHVMGPALVWKELIRPVSRRQRLISAIIIGAELVLFVLAYAYPVAVALLGHHDTVLLNVWILMSLGIIFTAIPSATGITSEKEARSWPLLLGTTSTEWQIMFGKFAGVLRRCVFMWILLLFYSVMFWRVGIFRPLCILQITMVAVGMIVFLCGVGFYFSSRFGRTNSAVIGAFVFIAVIWFFVPLLMLLATEAFDVPDVAGPYLAATPFGQAVVVVSMTGDAMMRSDAIWLGRSLYDYKSTFAVFATMLGYMAAGLLFAWLAKCRFRRDVF